MNTQNKLEQLLDSAFSALLLVSAEYEKLVEVEMRKIPTAANTIKQHSLLKKLHKIETAIEILQGVLND